MASPSRQAPLGGSGLLQGSRARSYGSLVQSACSPVRERRLEHQLAPGDTLAGLALKYGVTVSLPRLGAGSHVGEIYSSEECPGHSGQLPLTFSQFSCGLTLLFIFPFSHLRVALPGWDKSCATAPMERSFFCLLCQPLT